MAVMEDKKDGPRSRRSFTEEFKADAVAMAVASSSMSLT